jgi:transposase
MVTGIDCSKDYLDVATIANNQGKSIGKFSNDLAGFKKLYQVVKNSSLVVMEATGPYYMNVAYYLKEKGIAVSVVNPLVIKRFCQMKLIRTKTDKKDAIMIANYGESEKPSLWEPPSDHLLQVQQLESYLENLKKRRTMVSNQLHSFRHTGKLSKELEKELEEEIAEYDDKISRKEKEIKEHLEKEHKKLIENLESIPGIGNRSAALLTITTNGFKNFKSYKQVISYYGVAPRKYESGSSVRGRSSICKVGMAQVRKTLFMAAKSAILHNKACKDLYARLRAKGKAYRVAMIAVVNKLIKQAFAIAKSGLAYNSEFAK